MLVPGLEVAGAEGETVGRVEEDVVFDVSASIAFCCAEKVVDEMGHPTPGPSRFCKVTAAAPRRASWEAVLLSVGKVSLTVGFVVTNPAATFSLRAWKGAIRTRTESMNLFATNGKKECRVRGTLARHENRFPIGAIHGAIAVPCT